LPQFDVDGKGRVHFEVDLPFGRRKCAFILNHKSGHLFSIPQVISVESERHRLWGVDEVLGTLVTFAQKCRVCGAVKASQRFFHNNPDGFGYNHGIFRKNWFVKKGAESCSTFVWDKSLYAFFTCGGKQAYPLAAADEDLSLFSSPTPLTCCDVKRMRLGYWKSRRCIGCGSLFHIYVEEGKCTDVFLPEKLTKTFARIENLRYGDDPFKLAAYYKGNVDIHGLCPSCYRRQVEANFNVARCGKTRKTRMRIAFAFYRLIKRLGVTEEYIAQALSYRWDARSIFEHLGYALMVLCAADEACPFKILLPKRFQQRA